MTDSTSEKSEVNALFEKLRSISNPPTEDDFNKIDTLKSQILPLLLAEVEAFSNSLDSVKKQGVDYIRHVLSLFLLAHYRHEPAYPVIIKLISHRGEKLIQLTGEVFTESLGRILASVYDGDLQPIKSVIENPALSPWLRAGALDSLMVLWKEDVLTREEVVNYLYLLLDTKLEKKSSYVWDAIALIAYDLHPDELESLLREAINSRLIDPMVLNEHSLSICVKEDLVSAIKNKENVVEGYMKSATKELTWWLYPNEEALDKGIDYAAMAVPIVDKKVLPGERGAPIGWRPDTLVHGTKKIGRNDPCYCGSGKKYKKCCGVNG